MTPTTLLVVGSPGKPHLRLLDRLPPETTVRFTMDPAELPRLGPHVEVALCDMGQGRQLETARGDMQRLRWVHAISAGIEHVLFPALVEGDVVLTNGRGAFKRSLAEFAMAAALHFAKDLPRLERQRRAGVWEQYDMEELQGRTMGIVGYGEIGRATAALAKAFGMRVLATRRRRDLGNADPLVDEMLSGERLSDLMARSDYVLVSAALTPGTRGMIGARELALMQPSAVLINVARGPVVQEAALVEVLEAGRIRGAALDVFDAEPLPAGHPFYGLGNVLLSPHTADHVAGWLDQAMEVFLENFERYRAGAPLLNVVDKSAGY